MTPKRNSVSARYLVTLVMMCAAAASGQSKFVMAFNKYKISHDQPALRQEIGDLEYRDCDLQVEIPALLAVLSDTSDPIIADFARSAVTVLAMVHATDGELFRAAIPIFERHLPDSDTDRNRKETDVWEGSIVMLEATFGFPPSPRVTALMYKMVDYKYDPWLKGSHLKP